MKIFAVDKTSIVSSKICDRCLFHAEKDSYEFYEFLSIDQRAGFGSIFGDGNHLKLDLCQHCVKALLNPWLSVSEPDAF